MRIRRRGGRKLIAAPEGSLAWMPHWASVDSTLMKALARAHRWRRDSHGNVVWASDKYVPQKTLNSIRLIFSGAGNKTVH
jgi:hypothetical protein